MSNTLHNPYVDPNASMVIGVLLAAVAVLLGRESGALVVGEWTTARDRKIKKIIPRGITLESLKFFVRGSYLNLLRLPCGVSMITKNWVALFEPC